MTVLPHYDYLLRFILQPRGSFMRKSHNETGKWKSSTHHLLLNVKNFGLNVGETSEVHFRLYDAKENKFFRYLKIAFMIEIHFFVKNLL